MIRRYTILSLHQRNRTIISKVRGFSKTNRLIDHLRPTITEPKSVSLHEIAITRLTLWIELLPFSLRTRCQTVLHRLQHHNILSFIEDVRQSQLQSLIEEDGKYELTDLAKKANFITNASLIGAGFIILGQLFYWPLRLLSIPILIYRLILLVEDFSLKLRARQGIFNVELLEVLVSISMIVQNYLFMAILDNILFGIARILIENVKQKSRSDMLDVFQKQLRTVWVFDGRVEIATQIESVQKGDMVVVHAGETIPIDGTIINGTASVDQQILTGEAQLVEKGIGDVVFAMTLVQTGTIYVFVEKTGKSTTAAQISQILTNTVDFKTGRLLQTEKIADRAIKPLVALSVFTFPFIGLRSSIVILDSHFKRKVSIAAAISILNFFKQAAAQGILIKDGRTLELLLQVDTIVFDKTGTLTLEQPHVGAIHTCHNYLENEILALAAAAEYKQSHPIALAIQEAAAERALAIPDITDVDYQIGYGLTAMIHGEKVSIGSARFINMMGISIPIGLVAVQEQCYERGHSLVFVAKDGEIIGALELHATIRPEAKKIIQLLRSRNISQVYIVSGDHEAPTRHIARELNVDHYFAEVLPEDKSKLIEQLQIEGRAVCFVGDGINDSIALKKANVSVSLRGASTLAIDTAHVILMDQSLNQLDTLFEIAKKLDTNTKQIFGAVVLPCSLCLIGALFFKFTLVTSTFLNLTSLGLGVGSAILPMFEERSERGQISLLSSSDSI